MHGSLKWPISVADEPCEHVRVWRAVSRRRSAASPVADLISAFCDECMVSKSRLLSRARSSDIVWMRYCLVNVINGAMPDVSAAAIGRLIKRDHSTVIYLLCRLDKLPQMFTNPVWKYRRQLIQVRACMVG